MFSAVAHKSPGSAEGYFEEHLTRNDYYNSRELKPGEWVGVGSQHLGLNGNVTQQAFHALCHNEHPMSGERLTQRQQAENVRRVFYDFTCSAPKSVSVLAVTLKDERLIAAHESAVRIAFGELESFAATRVRKQGTQGDRTTGNLVAASFTHTSSRALDPQLHTHLTVFNATFDREEKRWKALQAGSMYEAIRYGTAVYRNELARRVQDMGYRIRPDDHGFQIDGVNEDILKLFSQRSQQRDQVVREMEQKLGHTLSNNGIAIAVHQSRASKVKGISTEEVRERQLARLAPEQRHSLEQLCSKAQPVERRPSTPSESQALKQAMDHVFERQSVVAEHELLRSAIASRMGEVDLRRLKQALEKETKLIRTPKGLSTQTILDTELSLIQTVNRGCETVPPLHPGYLASPRLGEDQQRAIYHILRTNDRITGLRGLAGSGKTTALKELVTACRQAGITPVFCAPTAAATDVLRKEGFTAMTLQHLLQSKRALTDRDLVVLDEAGAVGMDDMKRLFDSSPTARIVLSGDTGQHASVARGDALRILENHSQLKSGQLDAIRRQRKSDYRRAVELAAVKETDKAYAQLEGMGAVSEVTESKLHTSAASAYLRAIGDSRTALLVAPTWSDIERVTEKVREALKSSGRLQGQEKEIQVFDSLSWTAAQKKDLRLYRSGMTIRFHKAAKGFAANELLSVQEVEGDSLKVQRSDGSSSVVKWGLGVPSFDVGVSRAIRVATGEKLLLQSNFKKQFVNGELVQVKSVQGDAIELTDGRKLPAHYRTFTHGYAVTSHAAQGKTVDEVILVCSGRSLPAVHREQFYVSISRGRDRCQIFTDDAELLRSHVTRSSARLAAVEVAPHKAPSIRTLLARGVSFLNQLRASIDFPRQKITHRHHEHQSIPSQRISI